MKITALFSPIRCFSRDMGWILLYPVLHQQVLRNFRIRDLDQLGRLHSSKTINFGNRWIHPLRFTFFCVILLSSCILNVDRLRNVLLWAIMDRRKSLFPRIWISSNENNMQHIKLRFLILSLTKKYNPCQYFKCMFSKTNKIYQKFKQIYSAKTSLEEIDKRSLIKMFIITQIEDLLWIIIL